MKHLLIVLICFTLFCCFTGCHLGKQNKDVVDENFYCKVTLCSTTKLNRRGRLRT